MSQLTRVDAGPICGCAGCIANGRVRIRHPDHGPMVVCGTHVQDYEVIGNV